MEKILWIFQEGNSHHVMHFVQMIKWEIVVMVGSLLFIYSLNQDVGVGCELNQQT